PLLHQQSGHGREAVRQSRSESLEYRKLLPLGSRYDLSRGRVADPRKGAEGELCLAQSLHLVAPEAASRGPEHRHETSLLWLERKLHAGSPYRGNGLVSAGPDYLAHLLLDQSKSVPEVGGNMTQIGQL